MTDRKHVSPARCVLSALVVACMALVPSTAVSLDENPALDQTGAEEGGGDPEEVVVTGTRKSGLEPTETLSPVDALANEALLEQASFDLTEGIGRVAPSARERHLT